jgi:hypothetical protein
MSRRGVNWSKDYAMCQATTERDGMTYQCTLPLDNPHINGHAGDKDGYIITWED